MGIIYSATSAKRIQMPGSAFPEGLHFKYCRFFRKKFSTISSTLICRDSCKKNDTNIIFLKVSMCTKYMLQIGNSSSDVQRCLIRGELPSIIKSLVCTNVYTKRSVSEFKNRLQYIWYMESRNCQQYYL